MALTIEIFNRHSGKKGKPRQTYFRVKAANGETIAQSEGYNREGDCRDTVDTLILNMREARVVDKTEKTVRREHREGQ